MSVPELYSVLALVCLIVQPGTVGGQVCKRAQTIGLRNCSADYCYVCTISKSGDYAEIPGNAVAIQLKFSPWSTGLGSTARLPDLGGLRELEMSLANLGTSPVIPGGYFSSAGQLETLTIFHHVDSSTVFGPRLVNGSFSGLSKLTQLHATALRIAELPVGVFEDLVNLRYLDLTQNSLTGVAAGTFAELRQLVTLLLGRNRISSLGNVSFEGLQSLETLDLHRNEIRKLRSSLDFLPLGNLRNINLASNQMVTIEPYAFTGLHKLEHLYLDNNNITGLAVNVFNDLTNLATLDLRMNALQRLPVSLFSDLRSLKFCDLSENLIESVPAGAFDGLQRLNRLYLKKNRIQSVDDRGFEGLESLESLDLSENQIVVVGSEAFPSLRRLEWLSLSSNRLASLEFGTTDGFNVTVLSHLDLSLNPWNCSCDNYWLVVWLQMYDLRDIVANLDSTTCQSPDEWRNRTLLAAYDDTNQSCANPFPVETTPTGVYLPPTERSRTFDEEGLSKEAQIGIVIGSVVAAVAIVVVVAVLVHFQLKRIGFWDRKQSEAVEGLPRGATKNASAASTMEARSNGGYDNHWVISDDGSGKGQGLGQWELPVRDFGSGTAGVGIAVLSEAGSTRQLNNAYVYDNPTLLDDGKHI